MRTTWRWIAGTGAALAIFDFASPFFAYARRGFVSHRSHPPIFGSLHPRAHVGLPVALALGALGVVAARAAIRRCPPAWLVVGGGCVYLFSFSAAVAFIQGRNLALWGVRTLLDRTDVLVARTLGVKEFVREYPLLAPHLSSIHSVTHPPGRVLAALFVRNVSGSLGMRAAFVAAVASLVLVPAWFAARKLAGERVALFTVLLLAVAPTTVMMGWVSYEAVEAAVFTTVIALFVCGGAWDSEERAARLVLGGALLGLAAFLTYAVVFVAAFVVFLVFLRRPWRAALRVLVFAAIGGVAGLAFLRVVAGYDVFEAYRASHQALHGFMELHPKTPPLGARPYLYWLFGNPAAWLTFAGLPIAALAIRELIERRPKYLLAMAIPVGLFYLMPAALTRIIPGEVERTIQYALPVAAIAAASALVRAEEDSPALPAILVAIAIVQTIALQTLFFTFW